MPETRILLEHAEDPALRALDGYKGYGGYATLEKAYRQMEADEILKELEESGLRGRGGAGFSMGKKASFLPRGDMQKYLCCNADESEPGAFKDRELMQRNPHQLIEGIAIAAIAAGAGHAFIFIRGEYDSQADILDAAVAEAYEAGYLGKDILGTRRDLELVVHRGAGAYICGEETALLESLEGKKGLPRFKPPFPASFGLYGKPTTINNTETFAAVPWIVNHGADAFLALGRPNNGGTKIFSVTGHVARPGNYEVKLGTPFAKLLEMAGGMRGGRKLKAVIPGGSSMPVLPAEIMIKTDMDYDSIAKAGSMLGSGAVIVMDETTCMVKALERLSYFYFEESCGQCTPCREGTGWLYRMVNRIEHGKGRSEDLELLVNVADNIAGRTICALGDAAALPVKSFIQHFRSEFQYHIDHKRCRVTEPGYSTSPSIPQREAA
jgi:NADH-quinone oxidoreductase subunit F